MAAAEARSPVDWGEEEEEAVSATEERKPARRAVVAASSVREEGIEVRPAGRRPHWDFARFLPMGALSWGAVGVGRQLASTIIVTR